MADIRLAKPAAGTTQTVPSAPNGRFIFDFPADAATLTRNGDDLVLTFEDGSSIQLQGFYTTYSKEEMPSFQVEGVEISGQDFFAALGEDLMPAAGPAASSASRSGRYNEYGGSDLLDGIDHLGRLDIGFDGGTQLATDTVEPSAPEVDIDYDVTIAAGPEAGAVDLTVYEGGLAGGSQAGQAATPTTASGSLNINAPDGVASIVIGDVVVYENGKLTGNVVTTDEGTLAVTGYDPVTGKLDFSYTLDRNTTEHDKSDPATDTQISHDLTVTVTDTDGDSDSTTITVNVVDDVPTIGSFSHEMSEGDAVPVVGNALTGAVAGADGANFAWDANQNGHFGTITLNADGTYSYRLDNDNATVKELTDGETLTEEFTYTYTDADGDIAEGKVTITINGKDNGIVIEPTDPAAGSDKVTVYESGLADGSQAGQDDAPTTASGSLIITAPDGVASIVIGGIVVFEKGGLTGNTVSTDEGTLTVTGFDPVTGELKFTYELSGNTTEHSGSGMDDISHDLTVTVMDMDGTEVDSTITVDVVDDVPTAHADSFTLTEAQAQAGGSGENVLSNDVFGADAPADKTVTSIDGGTLGQPVSGKYGELTLNADGSYSYKLNAGVDVPKGESVTEEFTYTITDADGDTSEATLTITIRGDEDVPVVTVETPEAGDANIMVDEGALVGGSGQHTEHGVSGSGSFTVNLNGEDGVITVGGESGWKVTVTGDRADVTGSVVTVNGVAVTVTGATQAADGTWTVNYGYALDSERSHATSTSGDYHTDELTGEITISVTDSTGDTAEGTLTVEVHDDGPVAKADDVTLTEAAAQAGGSGENVLSNDVFGADAPADKTVTSIDGGTLGHPVKGQYGELTLNADGTYSYKLNAGVDVPKGESVTEEFTYTITDTDGDTSEATLTISINGDGRMPEITLPDVGDDSAKVYESGLNDGGSEASTDKETTSGEIALTLNGEAATVTIGGHEFTVDADGNATIAAGGESIDTGEGILVITGISDGKISYTYTLKDNQTHAEGLGNNTLTDKISISVKDATGDEAGGNLVITIVDDVPVATTDIASVTEGGETTASGDVTANDKVGADGLGHVEWTGVAEGSPYTVSENGTVSLIKEDGTTEAVGTLRREADGKYTFTLDPDYDVPPEDLPDLVLGYTTVDGDGDRTDSTLTISINGDGRMPEITLPDVGDDSAKVYESGLNDGGSEASTDKETTSGEIALTLNGEAATVTIGGHEFTVDADGNATIAAGGESIDTGEGILVITGISDGKISYTYTLKDNQTHAEGLGNNTLTDKISISVKDATGDEAGGNLVITIVDDVPVLNSITVDGTPYGEGDSGVYIKDPNRITGTLDGLNTGADAEGSTMRVHIEDDYFIGTYESGKWEFTPAKNDFTPDETEGGSFSFDGNKFTYIPSVQVEPGKDFSYTMQVTVTDGDGDSTLEVKSATMRPENNPPIAEDDSFYIDKDSHFESEITVQTNGTLISVKGEASFKGNVAGDTGAAHTLEYGNSLKGVNGSAVKNEELATETSDDFFGRFFKDSNGNPLTMDDMVENGMLQTVVINSSMHESAILKAINDAQTEAEKEGKVLYITGENGEKVDISLSGHAFGTSDNPLTVIISGNMSASNQLTVNGFLYVDGDVDSKAQLTVNGGLAVSGNMEQGGAVHGTYPEGGEVSTEIIGSVNSFEISFDDILKNDFDPDNESISIVEDTITLADGLENYYSISVDYGNGIVTVTPLGGSDGIADYEQPLKLEYTIQDEHGATDSAVITVSAVGHVTGSSHADTIIGSSASEVITADVSGTGGLNVPGQNYNVCVVMDSSGSIGDNGGIGAVKAAITGLAKELSVFDGEVNFAIVDFDSGSRLIEFSGPLSQLILTDENGDPALDAEGKVQFNHEFSNALNTITEGGGTNYEAGLNSAKAWFGSQAEDGKGAENGYTNYTFFVTDGQPSASWADTMLLEKTVTIQDVYGGEWTENGVTYRIEEHSNFLSTTQELQVKNESNEWITVDTRTKYNFLPGSLYSPNESVEYHIPLEIPQGEGPGYEWTVDGVTYRLAEGDKIPNEGQNVYSSNRLDVIKIMEDGTEKKIGAIAWNNDDKGSSVGGIDTAEGKEAADSLKEVSEIFAIGIGSKIESLDEYASDAQHVIKIGDTNDLLDAFMSGMQTITNAIPSSDVVLGGRGNDILFGDSGVSNLAALIAGKLGVDVAVLTSVQVLEYINSHPEEFDVSYSEKEIDGVTVAFDKADILLGGSGDDIVYGQGGDDLLFGDGSDTATSGTSIGTLNALDTLLTDAGAEAGDSYAERIRNLGTSETPDQPSELDRFIDSLEGTGGIEKDTDGNDQLFGGAGDDMIFGGAGDDFIDGGTGEDAIFGGAGNDIIVYDNNDYLVSGGSGIDFMVSDDKNLTLSSLLDNSVDDKPLVSGIEVLLKGDAALSLTSIQDLADRYGITLGTNADGQETLTLDMSKWNESISADGTHVFTSTDNDLTLETNLQHDAASSSDNGEMAQQVFILENTNS